MGEFFAMGGYAPYVWGSVGACALGMLAEPWLLRRQHRQMVKALRLRQRGRRAARVAAHAGTHVGEVRRQAA